MNTYEIFTDEFSTIVQAINMPTAILDFQIYNGSRIVLAIDVTSKFYEELLERPIAQLPLIL